MNNAEHGAEQADKRRGAADRCEHGETCFETAAFILDLLAQVTLQQIVAAPAMFEVLTIAFIGALQGLEAGRGHAAHRAQPGLHRGGRMETAGRPELPGKAPALHARAHALQRLDDNEGPRHHRENPQEPEGALHDKSR